MPELFGPISPARDGVVVVVAREPSVFGMVVGASDAVGRVIVDAVGRDAVTATVSGLGLGVAEGDAVGAAAAAVDGMVSLDSVDVDAGDVLVVMVVGGGDEIDPDNETSW